MATYKIQKHLSQLCDLSVIEPAEAEDFLQNARQTLETRKTISYLTEEEIVNEITHITVRPSVTPYFQPYMDFDASSDPELEKRVMTEIQSQLFEHTHEIVEKSEELTFDAIYGHDWMSVDAGLMIKARSGKPFILHVHSLDVDRISSQDHSWIYEVEKRGFEGADAIIAVSRFTADRIAYFYHIPKEKIHVVYHGHEKGEDGLRGKLLHHPLVLFVGRLSNQKGPNIFIEIAEEVLTTHPHTHFLIVGDGTLYGDLIERAAQKGIADRIHFTGYIAADRMKEIYAIADIYCMPSVAEPFGLSAMEAASAGLPMVISRQSGAAEILPGAMLSDHWNVQGFVHHITSLLDENPSDELVAMNEKAIHLFTWQQSVASIFKIISSQIT
jgi:hypothetical protein